MASFVWTFVTFLFAPTYSLECHPAWSEISCGDCVTGYHSSYESHIYCFDNSEIQDVTFSNCESDFDTTLHLYYRAGSDNGVDIYDDLQDGSDNRCDGDDCTSDGSYACSTDIWGDREVFTMENLAVGYYRIQLTDSSPESGTYKLRVFCGDASSDTSTPSPTTGYCVSDSDDSWSLSFQNAVFIVWWSLFACACTIALFIWYRKYYRKRVSRMQQQARSANNQKDMVVAQPVGPKNPQTSGPTEPVNTGPAPVQYGVASSNANAVAMPSATSGYQPQDLWTNNDATPGQTQTSGYGQPAAIGQPGPAQEYPVVQQYPGTADPGQQFQPTISPIQGEGTAGSPPVYIYE